MNCRKARQNLFGYFKEELTPEETARIKAHLDNCPDCAKEIEEISQINLWLKDGFQTFVPSPEFDQNLLARIQAISSNAQVKENGKWWLRFLHEIFPSIRLRWAMVGATAVIILAMVVTFTQRRVSVKPESLTLDTTQTDNQNLVNSENIEDSSYQTMLEKLAESSRQNRAYVIDNITISPNRGEDGRIRVEDMNKRFIIEKGLRYTPRRGVVNHYVLPVVSTQPALEKTDY